MEYIYIYIYFFLNVIYSSNFKAEFLASLLQSSGSHDPSEIILIFRFAAQKTFIIIIIMLKTAE